MSSDNANGVTTEYQRSNDGVAERGTCRNVSNTPSGFLCSECGWGDFDEPSHLLTTAKFTDNDGGPNFCPNCGRKVVDE